MRRPVAKPGPGFQLHDPPLIDGQDLLIVSRTSRNGRDQHDNDLITFHRFPDFRSLALNLFPGP